MGFGDFHLSYGALAEFLGITDAKIVHVQGGYAGDGLRIVVESEEIKGGLSYAPVVLLLLASAQGVSFRQLSVEVET
jgi:hypothetical protein|tara:strand:+ start:3318 stop:3548 length:231 start_codon:yes stop_codon:yes gene_type:complete